MSTEDKAPLPALSRGYRAPIKREWTRMAKALTDQGIDPHARFDLLVDYIRVFAEESDLDDLWQEATVSEKLALGRRFLALLNAKLRIRQLLFARAHRAA